MAERHLNDKGNFSFSEASAETLTSMVREVARTKPQAITILCTNLKGGPLVERLEQEIGIPIYDLVATAIWGSLRLAGADPHRVEGWGRLFRKWREPTASLRLSQRLNLSAGKLDMSTVSPRVAAQLTAERTSVRWKIFLMMLFLISINYIDRASLSVAMPLIAKEFNLDPAMQGLLLSSFFWTYAFMQVPGGMLADRFKPRIVIALATLGWGFFQAIAAFATNWVVLVLTRLGLGASEAPIYPAGGKLNAIWMTQNERGRGATLLDGGAPLGAAVGAIVIAWLIAAFDSWRMAFVVAGVGTMICGLWAWWYIRNTPREHPSVNEAEARYIEEAHAARGCRIAGERGRPLDRVLPLPVGLVHVPRLDVLQHRVLWPAHLDAELPVQGARA